ncbi:MAG: immunoglobulin domain-containing protein, partial [Flavobacteriales bacterium]|nr:immunoglobulin domain-containing protein [Flavobacteriales bacterium]
MRRPFLLCTLFSWACSISAQSVIQVTNLFDSGSGSFRNAVAIAFPLDTIRFQVIGTITVLNTSITYNKDLVIEGPGMDLLTLSGNDLEVPLRITGGSTWLSGITISNGREGSGGPNTGAGMGFIGDTLVMRHVRLRDNSFTGIGGNQRFGGGLRATAARLRIDSCYFEDNYILELPADQGSGYGGGLAVQCPDFRIMNSRIVGNTARGRASSGASFAQGGGMYLAGTGSVEHCVVDSNEVVSESFWQGNGGVDAHGYGGGICINDQSSVQLIGTSVSNNSISISANEDPYHFGGGVYVQRAFLEMDSCTVNNNYIPGAQPAWLECMGGGICVWDGALTLRNTVLDSNTGSRGSGIYFDEANNIFPLHKLVLERTRVLNGTGDTDAGAVHVWPADAVYLSDVEISGNSNRGLRVRQTDTLRVDRALIMENGGGAYVYEQPTNENYFINTTFYRNGADQGAGVLAQSNTTLSFINCTFMEDTLSGAGTNGREVHLDNSTAYFKNTILSSVVFQAAEAFGGSSPSAISGGGNICRDASFTTWFIQPNDLNSTNPQVGSFDDHGGFLRTWSLASNSTSIDQGGIDTLSVDARGFLRDGIVDAGAFEFGATQPDLITILAVSPNETVCVNHELLVSVDATSGAAIGYQWHLDGLPIPGATGASYSTAATITDGGVYTCVLTTSGDTITTDPIVIVIDVCAGITEAAIAVWSCHPSFARDQVIVCSSRQDDSQLVIRDSAGRPVFRARTTGASTILDITGLAGGGYTIEA